jgi:hypothetical protein
MHTDRRPLPRQRPLTYVPRDCGRIERASAYAEWLGLQLVRRRAAEKRRRKEVRQ